MLPHLHRHRPPRIVPAALLALAAALLPAPAPTRAQERYQAELTVIGDKLLGDWYEAGGYARASTLRIRLEPDGRFLHGDTATFGRHPGRWQARRLTLVGQENLVVRWADRGTCAYFVGLREEDGREEMVWRPYRDDRDFGGFDGILTRALLPWGPCAPMEWQRQPPPPAPNPNPDFPPM